MHNGKTISNPQSATLPAPAGDDLPTKHGKKMAKSLCRCQPKAFTLFGVFKVSSSNVKGVILLVQHGAVSSHKTTPRRVRGPRTAMDAG